MATPDYSLEAMQLRRDAQYIYFENKYICWRHNAATGALDGAFVRYGSNSNLLVKPVETVIQLMDQETCLTYNLERQEGAVVKADGDTIVTEYLLAARGDEVKIRHEVVYKPWGSGLHAVTISAGKRVNNLFSVQLCSTAFAPAMDQFTWRPTLEAGLGTWAQNNTPTWIPLNSGARRQDMYIAHKRLPLCFMVIQRGVEGIEFALGDNLEEWQAFRPENMLPSPQMEFGYDTKLKGYRTFVSPYHGREDGFIEGEHTFHFNMTLPFVREKMSPLRPGGHFFPIGKPFEERWPDEEFTAARAEAGMDLFRLHNDGDRYGNGIFWRDAAYPPYPADEMEKMDAAIALTHKYNMKVVPYFSVKELHPDVEDFGKYGEEWARRDEPNGYLRVNRSSGTRIFGYQMCLKSGWMKKRIDTIREVLENHAFDGIYYDWCCGLECFGKNHCGYWHWDNDEFMELLNETRNICGREKEMYLHTSHVISLGSENLATLLLTEEAEFPRIGPEMFTP
ncbi:MAG: hypothetical protein J6S21_00660, partial [Victivallales bacterium]|nr:hypothetical protein [Victivallales bacterium]